MDTNVKVKCVVYLNEKMHEDLMTICDEMGLSKPDYIRYCIANTNLGYKKAIDGIDTVAQNAFKNA